jgi:hypothetical protein
MSLHEPLLQELSALAVPALDGAASERLRARALEQLSRCTRRRPPPVARKLRSMWRSGLEPVLVVLSGTSFLLWALSTVIALY